MEVYFYTRPGCHLCDDARLMLKLVQEDVSFEMKEVNIEEDDALHEKYMLMIPVIEENGDVLLFGSIGYADIVELYEWLSCFCLNNCRLGDIMNT